MCLDFLRSLASRRAPLTLTAEPEVHRLQVLRAAGLVQALFMRPAAPDAAPECGRFLAITRKGRQVLDSGTPPQEPPQPLFPSTPEGPA